MTHTQTDVVIVSIKHQTFTSSHCVHNYMIRLLSLPFLALHVLPRLLPPSPVLCHTPISPAPPVFGNHTNFKPFTCAQFNQNILAIPVPQTFGLPISATYCSISPCKELGRHAPAALHIHSAMLHRVLTFSDLPPLINCSHAQLHDGLWKWYKAGTPSPSFAWVNNRLTAKTNCLRSFYGIHAKQSEPWWFNGQKCVLLIDTSPDKAQNSPLLHV